MAENNNNTVLENICSSLERKPQSIKDIVDKTGHQRSTVAKYLKTLSKTGMIKSDKVGRQKVFWRPILSDRQTGLELRGAAYELSNLRNNVEEAQEKIERLIEESTDPELENQSLSKQNEEGEQQ
jgi:predicted transcriptional regulator